VSTHRTRILQKMELKTNAELTQYAMRQGLLE
jgi:DNA-binding NarL/FixJ family response regulator